MAEEPEPESWPRGWSGSARDQRRRFRALPIEVKLDMIEELHRLARDLDEARRRRAAKDSRSTE